MCAAIVITHLLGVHNVAGELPPGVPEWARNLDIANERLDKAFWYAVIVLSVPGAYLTVRFLGRHLFNDLLLLGGTLIGVIFIAWYGQVSWSASGVTGLAISLAPIVWLGCVVAAAWYWSADGG